MQYCSVYSKILLLFCSILLLNFGRAQTISFPNQQVDQMHIHAQLHFDTVAHTIHGNSQLQLVVLDNNIDSIRLDAVRFTVHDLKIEPEIKFKFTQRERAITLHHLKKINPGDTLRISIKYSAKPQRGLYFVGWDDASRTAPRQIWSQGQGIDNRHWLPLIDDQRDKLTTEIAVDFATNYVVISNGKMADKKQLEDGQTRWIYKMEKPHSPYLIMLAIGKYDSFMQRSAQGTDLVNYFYPNWESRNATTYFKNREIISFLEEEIPVKYPWYNYKQVPVQNFQHGAMENTSATIFGDFFCVDSVSFNDENYVGVNAHEFAHQWFGNLVTAPNSTHHWLHEGFASYFAWLAQAHIFGAEKFNHLKWQSLKNVEQAEAQNSFPLANGKAGTWRFYDKGAWVLYMLRTKIGDRYWRLGLKNYLEKYQYKTANTAQFQAEMEAASNEDLSQFFSQWVRNPGMPELKLHIEQMGDKVKISISQLQENQRYQLAIPITFVTSKHTKKLKVLLKSKSASTTIVLPKGESLRGVFPDPEFTLLASWQVDVPKDVFAQMASTETYVWPWATRAWADSEYYSPKGAKKMQEAGALQRQTYAVFLAEKCAATSKLAPEEIAFLQHESELEVIRAFLHAAHTLPKNMLGIVEDWLQEPSYDVVENALVLLAINDAKNAPKYLAQSNEIYGTRGNNVRVKWLLINQLFGDNNSQAELIEMGLPKYDFITRMYAFSAWQQARIVTKESIALAFAALLQNNRKLRAAAKNYIVFGCDKAGQKGKFQDWVNANSMSLSEMELARIFAFTKLKPEKKN